jgi:membrane-bound serine protease (ClpP class)
MDTPEGLATGMWATIKDIPGSSLPAAGPVTPGGGRTAGASTYILNVCILSAMAGGTNVGSANPIVVGRFIPSPPDLSSTNIVPHKDPAHPASTGEHKVLIDPVAYIQSLAERKGINADWAEQSVQPAENLFARYALKRQVIDLESLDVPSLFHQINGKSLLFHGQQTSLPLVPANIPTLHPEWTDFLPDILSRPDTAYFLFLLGIIALAFEFSHPGFVLPGITGLLSLILAFFAFMILPVNITGILLLVLGVSLMITEVLIGTFGALGIAGILFFFLGSLFFYRTPSGLTGSDEHPSFFLIFFFTFLFSGFFLGVLRISLKARFRPVLTGKKALIGEKGIAIEDFQKRGRIKLHSEIWWATSHELVKEGQEVIIVNISGLTLFVKAVSEEKS